MDAFYSFCRGMGIAALFSFISASAYADVILTPADEQQIRELIFRWNDVLNKTPDAQPQSLYAVKVAWYGQSLAAQQVLANEQTFLAKNNDYIQWIVSPLAIQPVEQSDSLVAVGFVKRAGMSRETAVNYPQEMQVVNEGPLGWRIVSETDGITRINQSKEKSREIARGKFDGQHLSYAWTRNEDPRTGGACLPYSECNCTLWNSDPAIQPVEIPQCLADGNVEALSHLDDSGRDRVVVFQDWWSSSSRLVYVYDIQQGQWVLVLPAIARDFNLQEAVAADIVQRDRQHPGYVNVTQAVWDEANEVTTTKVVSQTLWVLK